MHRTTRLLSAVDESSAGAEPSFDRISSEIRGILGRTLARGMEEVGNYLLKTFYGNDPATYRDPSAPSHLSLRELAARCGTIELPVSASFLSVSIRIAVTSRDLPPTASFLKLPMSHRAELIRLPAEKVEPAAATALRTRTSVRELRDEVKRLLAEKGSKRGRPPTPRLMKLLTEVRRATSSDPARPVTPAEIAKLTSKQRQDLEQGLAAASEYIAGVRDALRRA